MTNRPLLLVVDDEPAILHMLKESLEDEQYVVETLSDGHKTIDMIGKLVPDLVLLDIFMPQCNGIEILVKIKQEYPKQKVMMISGFGTIQIATEAIKKGAADFIEKPLNLDEILSKIAFTKTPPSKVQEPNSQINDFYAHGIIGASALFGELMNHVPLVAPLSTSVIIYGPHGSGKTLIAQYLHAKSNYARHAFTLIDCQTANLQINEMLNTTGTLLLKNIDKLSDKNQSQLLNFLHNANKDLRIIATSLPGLFAKVQSGRFNPSLFSLLNATPIEIPPLTKRGYDIPLLADHFLAQANKFHNKTALCTVAATRILRNHNWTGDVAELKLFMENLITKANTLILDAHDVQNFLQKKS